MSDNKSDFVAALQEKGKEALKPLYMKTKAPFLAYMRRYTNDRHLQVDAFHEAMIAFYEYCVRGKYDPNLASPKTLIIKMGSAYLMNRLKKEGRNSSIVDNDLELLAEKMMTRHLDFSLSMREMELKKKLTKLGEKCREILLSFFYYNMSIESIRVQMGYKNDNVVSSHKSRCLKKLREQLLK